MPQPFLSNDTSGLRLSTVGSPSRALIIAMLWLLFACGVPLYQLREVRRQARQDLLHTATADKPDAAGLIAAFDRANQDLDAAAFGPCLLLAFSSILLVNQLFKLKRQCHALAHDLSLPRRR